MGKKRRTLNPETGKYDETDDDAESTEAATEEAGAPTPAPPVSVAETQPVEDGLSIQIEIPEPKPDQRKRYWVGLVPDCPLDSVTAGCCGFSKYTYGLSMVDPSRPDIEMANQARVGGIARLDPEELKVTLDHIKALGVTYRSRTEYDDNLKADVTKEWSALLPYVHGMTPLAYYVWIAECSPEFIPYPGSKVPKTLATPPGDIPRKKG